MSNLRKQTERELTRNLDIKRFLKRTGQFLGVIKLSADLKRGTRALETNKTNDLRVALHTLNNNPTLEEVKKGPENVHQKKVKDKQRITNERKIPKSQKSNN